MPSLLVLKVHGATAPRTQVDSAAATVSLLVPDLGFGSVAPVVLDVDSEDVCAPGTHCRDTPASSPAASTGSAAARPATPPKPPLASVAITGDSDVDSGGAPAAAAAAAGDSNTTTTVMDTSLALTRSQSQEQAAVPGTVGLINLGNTCFMASTLHCLGAVTPLTRFFLSGEWTKDINAKNVFSTKVNQGKPRHVVPFVSRAAAAVRPWKPHLISCSHWYWPSLFVWVSPVQPGCAGHRVRSISEASVAAVRHGGGTSSAAQCHCHVCTTVCGSSAARLAGTA